MKPLTSLASAAMLSEVPSASGDSRGLLAGECLAEQRLSDGMAQVSGAAGHSGKGQKLHVQVGEQSRRELG